MRRLLLTGFEPFDGYSVNPTAELAKRIDGANVAGFLVTGAVLPLDYAHIAAELDRLLATAHPDVVIMTGQAERGSLTIERMGINSVGLTKKDNCGNAPATDIIVDGAPAAYFANINPHEVVSALRENGIPAFVSYHAGTYGCNYVLFNVLHRIYTGRLNARATFLHIPPLRQQAIEKENQALPTMDLDTILKAVSIVIDCISRR